MGRPRKPRATSAETESLTRDAPPGGKPSQSDIYIIERFAETAIRCPCVPDTDPDTLAAWAFQVGQACLRQSRALEAGLYAGEPIPGEPDKPAAAPVPEKSPADLLRETILLRFPPPPGFCRDSSFADLGDDVELMLDALLMSELIEHAGLKNLALTKAGEEVASAIVRSGGKP